MRKNWRVEKADDAPVINLTDAIEGLQAALPGKPRNELTQEDVTQAMVQFVQQSMNLNDEAAEHFRALSELMIANV